MHAPLNEFPSIAAAILAQVRERRPRVHCITNAVAQNFTANLLLACGAIPSMTIAREEIESFAARADALLVNLGTFDPERKAAADIATRQMQAQEKPWVLDPVLIERSPPRAEYARALVKQKPSAIRLNTAEFGTLSAAPADPDSVARYANAQGVVIALTGATDLVADGRRTLHISNGHGLMGLVTAMGCAASALLAACLAVEKDTSLAAAAALLGLGVAGELAGERARGPGSFAVEILDALYNLDRATLIARAKVA